MTATAPANTRHGHMVANQRPAQQRAVRQHPDLRGQSGVTSPTLNTGRGSCWQPCFTVTVFDHVHMNQDHRPGSDPDRILVAQLFGTAQHHARWRKLAQDEQSAAVTELRELAGGRAELLAEIAGIFEGGWELGVGWFTRSDGGGVVRIKSAFSASRVWGAGKKRVTSRKRA